MKASTLLLSLSLLCCLTRRAAAGETESPSAAESAPGAATESHWTPGEPRPGALDVELEEGAKTSADGAYGRFGGDLNLSFAFGAEFATEGIRGAARIDLRYYAMAGIYATYRDAFSDAAARPTRTVSCGVSLRPLFVPRWSKDLERGPALLDLALDSVSLGLGRYWDEARRGPFGRDRGFEAALGLGVPLLGRANGLWLEGYGELRLSDAPGSRGESAQSTWLALLTWQGFLDTPLARRTGAAPSP